MTGRAMRIPESAIEHYVRHGYVVVPDFLTPDELAAARSNFFRYFPPPRDLAATPERFPHIADDPEHLQVEFPFTGDALNDVSTHPELIAFVERVLGTRDVLLSQAAIWAKYAGTGDFEQEMHLDYQGNTLVVPRDDGAFRQVNMILYYSDVTPDMGPTHVVSKDHTRDLPVWPPFRSRKKYPELYRKEKPILTTAGGLFVFSMGTFHRASNMTADFGARFSHHLVWRAAAYPFQGYHQWSKYGENDVLERFIEHTTPRQREVLGFPPPGHPYWNGQTLAGVALRYPKMDLAPYREAHGAPTPPPKPAPPREVDASSLDQPIERRRPPVPSMGTDEPQSKPKAPSRRHRRAT
jgi:ectoine hydroxylase-related dioxygenase (phytanoyl-CoA dioxygenase family)